MTAGKFYIQLRRFCGRRTACAVVIWKPLVFFVWVPDRVCIYRTVTLSSARSATTSGKWLQQCIANNCPKKEPRILYPDVITVLPFIRSMLQTLSHDCTVVYNICLILLHTGLIDPPITLLVMDACCSATNIADDQGVTRPQSRGMRVTSFLLAAKVSWFSVGFTFSMFCKLAIDAIASFRCSAVDPLPLRIISSARRTHWLR